jgi:hypothetical protein
MVPARQYSVRKPLRKTTSGFHEHVRTMLNSALSESSIQGALALKVDVGKLPHKAEKALTNLATLTEIWSFMPILSKRSNRLFRG